jgi:hypothetical protein
MKTIRKQNLELSKAAFEAIKDRLPESSVKDIREYVYDYNEWGLGVEMIVDVLLEDDIAITISQKKAIVEAMDAMGLDRSQHEIRVLE